MDVRNALTLLARLASRRPSEVRKLENALNGRLHRLTPVAVEVAKEVGDPVGGALTRVLRSENNPDLAIQVLKDIPERTTALGEFAVEAFKQFLEMDNFLENTSQQLTKIRDQLKKQRLPITADLDDGVEEAINQYLDSKDNRAGLKRLAAKRMTEIDPEGAFELGQEVIKTYRELNQSEPGRFAHELGMSLLCLSDLSFEKGQMHEALVSATEAIELLRDCSNNALEDHYYRLNLAEAIWRSAKALLGLHLPDKALSAAQEAYDLFSALKKRHPGLDLVGNQTASCLNTISNALTQIGRFDEALQTVERAVKESENLSAENPDAYLAEFAMALASYAQRLREVGRNRDALAASQQSVQTYRKLAKAWPTQFQSDLAGALHTNAQNLRLSGQSESALEEVEEALRIRRNLYQTNPQAYRARLPSSLNEYARILIELQRDKEACTAAFEATDHYRALSELSPDIFQPELVNSLNSLAIRLSQVDRVPEAVKVAEEALSVCSQLEQKKPGSFRRERCAVLNTLSLRLAQLGRREDALRKAQEAVDLYRDLDREKPGAFRRSLIQAIFNLSLRFDQVGCVKESLSAVEEALQILTTGFENWALDEVDQVDQKWIVPIVHQYVRTSIQLKRRPNFAFLVPIIRMLGLDALSSLFPEG